MTSPLRNAARALCKAQSGVDCFDDLEPEAQEIAIETVRAVLAAQWQPIETAPKDGTDILITAFRDNGLGEIYQEGGRPDVACWIETSKRAEDGAEINWATRGTRLRSSKSFSPTHWCPLPPPVAILSE